MRRKQMVKAGRGLTSPHWQLMAPQRVMWEWWVSHIGSVMSSKPSVMLVHPYEGKWLQASHTCWCVWPGVGIRAQHQCCHSYCNLALQCASVASASQKSICNIQTCLIQCTTAAQVPLPTGEAQGSDQLTIQADDHCSWSTRSVAATNVDLGTNVNWPRRGRRTSWWWRETITWNGDRPSRKW